MPGQVIPDTRYKRQIVMGIQWKIDTRIAFQNLPGSQFVHFLYRNNFGFAFDLTVLALY